jgi:cytochrome b561
MVWGLFRLPLIAPIREIGRTPAGIQQQKALHDQIEKTHLAGGWIMLVLLLLHLSGAFKHQFVDRRRQLQRMSLSKA